MTPKPSSVLQTHHLDSEYARESRGSFVDVCLQGFIFLKRLISYQDAEAIA